MAIIDPSHSVSSRFFAPLGSLLPDCSSLRQCPSLDDFNWIVLGVQRCLSSQPSGRGFLQSLAALQPELCPDNAHFFETLKSKRRLEFVREINERVLALGKTSLPDRLACFPCLNGFDVYASDGHSHEHACHDARLGVEEKLYAVGHIYARNLRNGLVAHLTLSDQVSRKKEHEMRALKRLSINALRLGAPMRRKVIHVYDRAAIDLHQWFKWKQGSGIYMISRTKENMALAVMGVLPFDRADGVNARVIADHLVGPPNGAILRRVTFHDVHSGRTFEYLTNLTDSSIPPGVIAQLYKMRWDLEKNFDEMKNKLGEKKAWAKSQTAKQMQAQFISLTLNLMSLLAQKLEVEEGITNVAESQRRQKRAQEAIALEQAANLPYPAAWQRIQQATQHSVKLYRWVAARLSIPVLWSAACDALRTLYAQL